MKKARSGTSRRTGVILLLAALAGVQAAPALAGVPEGGATVTEHAVHQAPQAPRALRGAPGDPPPDQEGPAGADTGSLPFDPTPVPATGTFCDDQRPSPLIPEALWQQKRLQLQRAQQFATGRGVTVAVVDTGVDLTNVQLRGVLADQPPARFAPIDEDNTPATKDCDGHGTAVAGIIAARPDPQVQFMGVARHASILPVKVTEADDKGSADVLAEGIQYAARQGVDIINVSVVTGSFRSTLQKAVRYALSQGIVVVVAAGNSGQEGNREEWPAAFADEPGFEGLIVVGATTEAGAVAPFTTTSVPISVVAPGDQVVSTAPLGGQSSLQGTSFAAPFVSGVAAMILQAYDKKLSPVEVKRRIELTADDPGLDRPDKRFGWGTVNPYEAVTAILPTPSDQRPPDNGPGLEPLAVAGAPDNTARNVALGVAGGAFVVTLFALMGLATVRRGRARRWQPG